MSNSTSKTAEKTASQVNGGGAITPHDAELLRGYVRSLEQLDDEGREIGQVKSAIYKEAKAAGLSTWAIREVVKRRREDPGVLEIKDELVRIYSDIAGGGTVRVAHPVERNEEAHQAGRADALAGHRDHAAGWRDKFGGVDYEIGHQEGERERNDQLTLAEAEKKLAHLQELAASRARAPAHEGDADAPFAMDRPKRGPRRRRAAEAFA